MRSSRDVAVLISSALAIFAMAGGSGCKNSGPKAGMNTLVGQASPSPSPSLQIVEIPEFQGLDFDPQIPQKVKAQIGQALVFLYHVAGRGNGYDQSAVHLALFGQLMGSEYRKFFTSRIRSLGWDPSEDRDGFAAYFDSKREPDRLYLTGFLERAQVPTAYFADVLLHEARHSEREHGNWPHVRCPNGISAAVIDRPRGDLGLNTGRELIDAFGQPVCDGDEQGTHGTLAALWGNIWIACENCTERQKLDALLILEDHLSLIAKPEARYTVFNDLLSLDTPDKRASVDKQSPPRSGALSESQRERRP